MRSAFIALIVTSSIANAQPDSIWSRTYGGPGFEICNDVQQTADGGFVLAGWTDSYGPGGHNFWVVKTNSVGDSLWARHYGGVEHEDCRAVLEIDGSGYLLAGVTWSYGAGASDGWVVRIDQDGDSLWSRTFGGSGADEFFSVVPSADGGFVLGGATTSFGSGDYDFWLVAIDENGDSLWGGAYGSTDSESMYHLVAAEDGGYLCAGKQEASGSLSDGWILNVNSSGDSLWSRPYGGEGDDRLNDLIPTTGGGYLGVGQTSGGGLPDGWMVKTNAIGDTLWTQSHGGSSDDVLSAAKVTANGDYVLSGHRFPPGAPAADFWLLGAASNGDSLWSRTFGGTNTDACFAIAQVDSSEFALAGMTFSFGAGMSDFWVVRVGSGVSVQDSPALLSEFTVHSAFPNPFNSKTTLSFNLPSETSLTLTVFDITGREVMNTNLGTLPAGTHSHSIVAAHLPSSIYFARLSSSSLAPQGAGKGQGIGVTIKLALIR